MKMSENAFRKYLVLFFTLILAGIASLGYAQVDQGELERNLAPVTFINYEGPHARIETREQIRQIGVGLGQVVVNGRPLAGGSNRYFVIHSVTDPVQGKLDADIFGLGVDVGVDHIRNLRTIIQGYLQTAYGYSASDASLLAEYITIYNAVYRGDWDYFLNRYKKPVMDNLSKERAGLSIRYDEWPGRTLIVIPLGYGGLSSIDTTTISDSRVVEELRKEDDMGVPQRQAMVDLKEREAEKAEQTAKVEREAIRQEERKITEQKTQTAQEKQQAEQQKQQVEQDRKKTQEDEAAGKITQEQAQQQRAEQDKREQEAEKKEQEAKQKEEETKKAEAAVQERKEEAQKKEEFAEQKAAEAQQDRQGIAQDQQAGIIETATGGVIAAMIEKKDSTMGRLIRLNPSSKQELRRSPLDTVYVRTLTFVKNRILAIAGENVGNGAIRLIEVNQGDLTMARQGEDDMHPGSLIWVNESDIYAITLDRADNSHYLGRFDTSLALKAKSEIKVHPNAAVMIQQGYLLTQKADGSIALLNPATLKE